MHLHDVTPHRLLLPQLLSIIYMISGALHIYMCICVGVRKKENTFYCRLHASLHRMTLNKNENTLMHQHIETRLNTLSCDVSPPTRKRACLCISLAFTLRDKDISPLPLCCSVFISLSFFLAFSLFLSKKTGTQPKQKPAQQNPANKNPALCAHCALCSCRVVVKFPPTKVTRVARGDKAIGSREAIWCVCVRICIPAALDELEPAPSIVQQDQVVLRFPTCQPAAA